MSENQAEVAAVISPSAKNFDTESLIANFKKHPTDCGSSEVQIAILTARIKYLSKHLGVHKKDKHSTQGLLKLVSQRKRLISYLRRTNFESYKNLIAQLGIRK
jgi:small subunit ribosomal protein S15